MSCRTAINAAIQGERYCPDCFVPEGMPHARLCPRHRSVPERFNDLLLSALPGSVELHLVQTIICLSSHPEWSLLTFEEIWALLRDMVGRSPERRAHDELEDWGRAWRRAYDEYIRSKPPTIESSDHGIEGHYPLGSLPGD